MCRKKNILTRREAIAIVGKSSGLILASTPLQVFLGGLVDGVMKQAQANTGNVLPRNYVLFHQGGGPTRFMFDQFLNPFSPDSGIVANPGVYTSFAQSGSAVAGAIGYRTLPITVAGKTINVPPLWLSDIPTTSGSTVPMASLLANLLSIRGVNNPQASHFAGAAEKLRPSPGSPSLNGLVADGSPTPVPAVGVGSFTTNADFSAFKSASGVGQAYVNGVKSDLSTNMSAVESLLAPFDKSSDLLPSAYLGRRAAFSQLISGALSQLSVQAKQRSPGAESLYTVRNSAEKMLTQGVRSFIDQYPSLLAKYRSLIAKCADFRTYPAPGITDKVVSPDTYSQNYRALSYPDQPGFQYATNPDMRTITTGAAGYPTTVFNLAESFAIAELLLLNRLSGSIVSCIGNYSVGNVNFLTNSGQQPPYSAWLSDEHIFGIVPSLIVNTFIYRSFMACLYEFSQRLQSQGLWEETVVELVGDFPRAPQLNGAGSGHAGTASVYSIFSGAIQKPIILGNVLSDGAELYPQNPDLKGSWGQAAPVQVDGSSVTLLNGHVSSTVADLLRVQHIMTNNSSLVSVNPSGGVTPTIELARNK